MLTFLFWNLSRKDLTDSVAELARSRDVDLLVLAEYTLQPELLLEKLNQKSAEYFFAPDLSRSLTIFSRFHSNFLLPVFGDYRFSIRHMVLPARDSVLVAMAHLPSQLHHERDSLAMECIEFSEQINAAETKVGHKRTVVLGDLNLNPFDTGLISTKGLHAVSSRLVASRGTRQVSGREYHFFYNPMWSHLGDRDGKVPGTYYYDGGDHLSYYWHAFDQALVRPDLLRYLNKNSLEIVSAIGEKTLLNDLERPDKIEFSDHLPVLLSLQM
jgi:hypothetical protein